MPITTRASAEASIADFVLARREEVEVAEQPKRLKNEVFEGTE